MAKPGSIDTSEAEIDTAGESFAQNVPEIPFDHVATHWRISLFNRSIEAEQTAIAKRHRLTINDAHLLMLLRLSPPRTYRPSDLSDRLFLSNAAITGCMVRLAERQLITQSASQSDRRVRFVELTAAGESLVEVLVRETAQDLTTMRVIRDMPAEMRAQFDGHLRWLVDRLRAERSGEPRPADEG